MQKEQISLGAMFLEGVPVWAPWAISEVEVSITSLTSTTRVKCLSFCHNRGLQVPVPTAWHNMVGNKLNVAVRGSSLTPTGISAV